MNIRIQTGRLVIRSFSADDLIDPSYISLLSDTRLNKFLSTRGARLSETQLNIDLINRRNRIFGDLLSIRDKFTGQLIGTIGTEQRLILEGPAIMFGILIGLPRQGYGSESLDAVINYFEKKHEFKLFLAGIDSKNTASISLFTSLGFTLHRKSGSSLLFLLNKSQRANM